MRLLSERNRVTKLAGVFHMRLDRFGGGVPLPGWFQCSCVNGRWQGARLPVKRFDPPSPEERARALARIHNQKMARSAHAYVRGNTLRFYEWLEQSDGKLPRGPPIWICGDSHVGNLGPLADADGEVAVQIRDLDQTVIGNPAHDLIRLGLSLASAARSSNLPGVTTPRMLEDMILGYEQALRGE